MMAKSSIEHGTSPNWTQVHIRLRQTTSLVLPRQKAVAMQYAGITRWILRLITALTVSVSMTGCGRSTMVWL